MSVARTDDSALAEHERLRSLLGSGQFGKDESGHERLRYDTEARLEHDERDGVRTVGVHAAVAVADSLLRLYREQQRRREVVDLQQHCTDEITAFGELVMLSFRQRQVGRCTVSVTMCP